MTSIPVARALSPCRLLSPTIPLSPQKIFKNQWHGFSVIVIGAVISYFFTMATKYPAGYWPKKWNLFPFLSPVQMYLKKMERITCRVPGCVCILSSDISASLLLSLLYVPWLFCSNRSLMSNLETLAKNKHIAGLSNEVKNVIKMSLTITVAVYEEVVKCNSKYWTMSIQISSCDSGADIQ